MVNSDSIREHALQLRDDCAADDGRHQDSRARLCEGAEAFDGEGKDAWKHHGIEKPDRKNAPYGYRAQTEHRSTDK